MAIVDRASPASPSRPVGIPTDRLWLIGLLALAFAARAYIALRFPSIHHPDEIFQSWEQGFRLVYGDGVVPWEFRDGIRSWLLPGLIGSVIWVVEALGGNDDAWRIAVRLLLAAASLSIVATAWFWARQHAGQGAAILAGLVAATWFELLYFSARPLTEVLAAATLFPAAWLLCGGKAPTRAASLWGGALLALSLVLRFHLVPAILLVAAVHVAQNPRRRLWPAALSASLVLLAAGALDWLTWGSPFQSIWLNLTINLLQDRASTFGVEPIHWYALDLARRWGPALPIILLLCSVGARRAPLLAAIPLVIFATHSLVGHKEARFLYPMLPFVLTLACIGAAILLARIRCSGLARTGAFALVAVAGVAGSAYLGFGTGFQRSFTHLAEPLRAFRALGNMQALCGLAIAGHPWFLTPGQSGLGRPVPLYLVSTAAEAEAAGDAFNAQFYDARTWPHPGAPYLAPFCDGPYCAAIRPGPCTPQPDQSINPTLDRLGH